MLRTQGIGIGVTKAVNPLLQFPFPGATLDLDFSGNRAFGRAFADITVARTGVSAFAPNQSLTLDTFAPNVLRRNNRGVWVEPGSTNLCLQSQTFATTWLSAAGATTSDVTTAPDGTLTADLFTEDSANASHGYAQTIATASNVVITHSVYVKPNGRTWFRFFMDDNAGNSCECYLNASGIGTIGSAINNGTGSGAVGNIIALANGWYRLILTGTPSTVSTGNVRILIRSSTGNNVPTYLGDGVSGFYVWGGQVEAFNIPTSYIPTVAAAQARGIDQLTLSGANFTSWFTGVSAGMFYVEAEYPTAFQAGGFPRLLSVSNGTVSNMYESLMNSATDLRMVQIIGGVTFTVGFIASIPTTQGVIHRTAITWTNGGRRGVVDNSTVLTDTTAGAQPPVTSLNIGNRFDFTALRSYCGVIRRIIYVPDVYYSAADLRFIPN